MEMACLPRGSRPFAWYNVRTHKNRTPVPGGHYTAPYFASRRTTGPVILHAFPFASVPLEFDCAVWADADTLHQRVRIVVDPRFGLAAAGRSECRNDGDDEARRTHRIGSASAT